ncbi:hypothetical protein R84B8_01840 [Treponema sp. R8-4-B8]
MNKAALLREIKKTTGVPLREASVCIDTIFEAISAAVARGERIELRGFGSFFIREVAKRKAAFANIPAHGRIIFRPCQKLRLSVWNKVARQNEQP